jgi:hypothetical protein
VAPRDPRDRCATALAANPISNSINFLAAITRRVDVGAEWPLSGRHVDNIGDRFRDKCRIRVAGSKAANPFSMISGKSAYRPVAYSALRWVSAGEPARAK